MTARRQLVDRVEDHRAGVDQQSREVAGLRDMLDLLIEHVQEVRYAAAEQPEDYQARMVVGIVD